MSPAERERYSRQILFSGIGEEGQRKLLASHVAIVGCGALGSFQAEALARAGVGRLTIIDRDYVESSNLQRQWLFEEADAEAALPKAVAAQRALARVNSGVAVTGIVEDLAASNIGELLEAGRSGPRRDRQLRDALLDQRLLRQPTEALDLRGGGRKLRPNNASTARRRPSMLSMCVPGTSRRNAANLRHGRRAGFDHGGDRGDSGGRCAQVAEYRHFGTAYYNT